MSAEARTFRIRACPECGTVQMPAARDDRMNCSRPAREHESDSNPRLAWFDVAETDSLANRLNQGTREISEPNSGFYEWTVSGDKVYGYQWASGARVSLPLDEIEMVWALLAEITGKPSS